MSKHLKKIFLVSICICLSSALFAAKSPVALIIAQGGLGDASWNDTAHTGFKSGLNTTGLKGKAIESNDVVAQGEELMRRAADSGFGLIISLEYSHGESMEKVAPSYNDSKFVILNQVRKGNNVVSILFSEHEGSYLAGALAAQVTTDTSISGINSDAVIGVIGGFKSPGIDKFLAGYAEGAKAINPNIKVLMAYSNSFGDPAKGEQMAQAMFEQGADIVYQVAGGTGIGIIEAAKKAGKYAIGVDTDQDGMAPGHVLTSMMKRVDVAVDDVIKQHSDGSLRGGKTLNYGLVENGVALSEMKHTRNKIPSKYIQRVEKMKRDIISGKIKVWDVTQQGYPSYMN